MNKYVASVRDKETKKIMVIEREYEKKKDFEIDLRLNGYSIRFISTSDKFEETCNKYYEKLEERKYKYKAVNSYYKEQAEKYGISTAHYKRAYTKWINDTDTFLSLEDFIEIYK